MPDVCNPSGVISEREKTTASRKKKQSNMLGECIKINHNLLCLIFELEAKTVVTVRWRNHHNGVLNPPDIAQPGGTSLIDMYLTQ